MSRRDTIIIAVLVNAALLMILFATAIRSGDSKDEAKKNKASSINNLAEAPKSEALAAPIQDELLNEFISSVPTFSEGGAETLIPFGETEIAIANPAPQTQSTPVVIDPFPTMNQIPLSMPSEIPIVTAPPPAPVKPEAQVVNVTVKKGDYLEKIAKANHTTVAAIMKANNMSSTNLKIGQVLKVPLTKGDKKTESSSSAAGEIYIVKEGDNPWLIASRNKINLEELLRLNNLDEQKAKRLRPGDKLKIR